MKEIIAAIQKGQPISLKTYTLPYSIEKMLEEILEKILIKYQKNELKNVLGIFIKEITGNAKKANLKRVFFKKKGLNINDELDYQSGMEYFRTEIMEQIEEYSELLEKLQYYIHVAYQYSSEGIIITVTNNVMISPEEMERIKEKYTNAMSYKAPEDAFNNAVDTTEGAGLGIIMIVLMLKKAGINPRNFIINSKDGITVSRLAVHFNKIDEETVNEITEAIYKQIKVLPVFPDSIERILDIISDKNSSMNQIANAIKRDPSLTTDILKLANSAQFMLPKRIASIEEAVKIVGFSGIKLLLTSYSAKKIIDDQFGEMEHIWEHSYRCAFYAQEIAKNRRLDKKTVEDCYLSGLLHDLGRFIVVSIKRDMVEKLISISAEKKLNIQILEDLTLGVTHAKVGAELARKWNFPDTLVEAIEFHHEPLFASAANKSVVFTVYLANIICNIEEGDFELEDIDQSVLEFFNLSSSEIIIRLKKRLNELYEEKQKRFS